MQLSLFSQYTSPYRPMEIYNLKFNFWLTYCNSFVSKHLKVKEPKLATQLYLFIWLNYRLHLVAYRSHTQPLSYFTKKDRLKMKICSSTYLKCLLNLQYNVFWLQWCNRIWWRKTMTSWYIWCQRQLKNLEKGLVKL